MRKLLKSKWLYIIVSLALVAVFEKNVMKLSLADRAVIVGLAVDYENSQMVVNSQVVLPSNSPQTTRSGIYAVFESRGATVQDALASLSEKIGLETSISHCLLMVLSHETLERAEFSSLSYLLSGDNAPDSMYVLSTEEQAKKILQANVPVGEVSSFHLGKVLMSQRRSLGVNPINIKEFFVNYYSKSGANFMPVATRVEVDLPNLPHPSTPTDDEVYIMKLERTAILDRNGYKLTLNDDESKALSLITARINTGNIVIDGEDGGVASLTVRGAKVRRSYDLDKKTASYTVDLKVKVADRSEHYGIGKVKPVTDAEAANLSYKLEKDVISCFEHCREYGVDVFNVYEGFFKKYGDKWEKRAGDDYIRDVQIEVKVNIKKE